MNYAIIGCGIIAFTHAKALAAVADARLYAVCDIIPSRADQFAREHGAEKVYYHYRELLADPQSDIICVCVPSGVHGEVCIAAAKAGKAIVCEKPLEITPAKIKEVIRAVRETGVKMQCVFQRRLMPNAIAVRRLIQSGGLGKITLAEADLRYFRDQAYYDSAGWRGTWDQDGGGALMNQGVHGVDLILWMLGGEIKSLYGRAETLGRRIAVEDTAAAVITMESGALCVIKSTTTSWPGYSTMFTVHGEKGTVSFNDEGWLVWDFIDAENAPPRPAPDTGETVGGARDPKNIGIYGHIRLLEDIGEAVRHNRPPMIPPEDAALAVQVICAIYESSRDHREAAVRPL